MTGTAPIDHALVARPWHRSLRSDGLALGLLLVAVLLTGSVTLLAQLLRHAGIALGHAIAGAGTRLGRGSQRAHFEFGLEKLRRCCELLLGLVLVGGALWLIRVGPEMSLALANQPPVLLALAATANFAWLLWAWPEEERRSAARGVQVVAQLLLTTAAMSQDGQLAHLGGLLAGVLIALLSLRHGARVVVDTVRDLIDRPVDPETLLPLLALIEEAGITLDLIRRLRSRQVGGRIFLELHLRVPPDEPLDRLSARLDSVSAALTKQPFEVDLAIKVH